MTAVHWFLWMISYSFLGWIYESILCSFMAKKPVNRGFLRGPICPIYGVGAVLILAVLGRIENPILLFLLGALLTCTLEYLTALTLETLFHAKWWDYSQNFCNIQGRVCLIGAVAFGAMAVALVKFLHPFTVSLIAMVPDGIQLGLALVILAVLLTDLVLTVRSLAKLRDLLREMQSALDKARAELEKKLPTADGLKESFIEKKNAALDSLRGGLFEKQVAARYRRIARAFPQFRHKVYDEAWKQFLEKLRQ